MGIVVMVCSRINDPFADFTMDNKIMRTLYSVKITDDPLYD